MHQSVIRCSNLRIFFTPALPMTKAVNGSAHRAPTGIPRCCSSSDLINQIIVDGLVNMCLGDGSGWWCRMKDRCTRVNRPEAAGPTRPYDRHQRPIRPIRCVTFRKFNVSSSSSSLLSSQARCPVRYPKRYAKAVLYLWLIKASNSRVFKLHGKLPATMTVGHYAALPEAHRGRG